MSVSEENAEILDAVARDATTALFESYDFPLLHQGSIADLNDVGGDVDRAGVVGFAGDELWGSLAIGMSLGTLLAFMKNIAGATSPHDWLGELSNQLCGRLKMKLLGHGATIYLSTPLAIEGGSLKVRLVGEHGYTRGHIFKTESGALVHVWMGADLKPSLTLHAADNESELPTEGDMLLF